MFVVIKARRLAALLVGVVVLAACDEASPIKKQPTMPATEAANDCLDLPVYPPAGISDLKQEVSACVERNAAMFAEGPDSMEALSRAVIATCELKIIRFAEQEAKAAGEKPQYNEVLEAWRRHTLPVIAEARARRCYS